MSYLFVKLVQDQHGAQVVFSVAVSINKQEVKSSENLFFFLHYTDWNAFFFDYVSMWMWNRRPPVMQ